VKELIAKYKKLLADAKAIAQKAEAEERGFEAEEKQEIKRLLKEASEIKEKLDAAKADEALKSQIDELSGLFDDVGLSGKAQETVKRAAGTIGERFVTDGAFKAWMERVAPSGRIPDGARGLVSPPVEVKDLLRRVLLKALITGESDASAGAFVETDYTRIYEMIGRYPLSVLDLVSKRQTTSDLVHFVRQTAQVTQATTVPEANVTEYSGGSGEIKGDKPEGTMTFEPITTPVETIAVWIPATKRALADVAQLRSLIDDELRADVYEELENQILNGNGVGSNFTGLFNTAGVLLQPWVTDIWVTTRTAIVNLWNNGRQTPTAWLLNPEDWATIELTRDTNGQFFFAGPLSQGPPRLWSYPVAQSNLVAQGTGVLGNWSKAVLWDRQDATITVSDSHEDFFIRNMVAILCELRAAFALIRPSAFVVIDLESGS